MRTTFLPFASIHKPGKPDLKLVTPPENPLPRVTYGHENDPNKIQVFPLWQLGIDQVINDRAQAIRQASSKGTPINLAVAATIPSRRKDLTLNVLADLERTGLLLIELPEKFKNASRADIEKEIREQVRLIWENQKNQADSFCPANPTHSGAPENLDPVLDSFEVDLSMLSPEEEQALLDELNNGDSIDPLW